MGQKTDTKNIYQIGKNNKKYIWDSKYFERKKNESNIFIFKNIEIKKFIKKVLKDHGLILYKYKISFLESNIKIFISYLKLPKSKTIINKINNNQKLRLIKKNTNIKSYKKHIKKYLENKIILKKKKTIFKNKIDLTFSNDYFFKEALKKEKLKIFLLTHYILNKQKRVFNKKLLIKKSLNLYLNHSIITKVIEYYNKKNYKNGFVGQNKLRKIIDKLSINKNNIKRRIKILQYYKDFLKIKKNKTIKNIKINNFLEKIIESLKKFTYNKFNIILNFQQVNNNLNFNLTSYQLQHLKKVIIQLRQFKKSKFFKEGVNLIFLSMIEKESSQLLANFIANQLKLVKRHGFFLKFLKKSISLVSTSKLSKADGIKIIIKGRFNGKRRSSKKIITINKNMPLMTLKSKIDSTQSTAYGSNGTFGVKVWINEKNNK